MGTEVAVKRGVGGRARRGVATGQTLLQLPWLDRHDRPVDQESPETAVRRARDGEYPCRAEGRSARDRDRRKLFLPSEN
jgi:hypothetical protein